MFSEYLGIRQTIWLGEGCVGDDTHGHIDDIARFVDARRRSCSRTRRIRRTTRTTALGGQPASASSSPAARRGALRIVKLPYPRPVMMNGERLPASYANFYIANGVVLVPTFNDPNDRMALNTLAELFPDRQVVGIHAVDLVWGLGTLHCLTQQQPQRRLRRSPFCVAWP